MSGTRASSGRRREAHSPYETGLLHTRRYTFHTPGGTPFTHPEVHPGLYHCCTPWAILLLYTLGIVHPRRYTLGIVHPRRYTLAIYHPVYTLGYIYHPVYTSLLFLLHLPGTPHLPTIPGTRAATWSSCAVRTGRSPGLKPEINNVHEAHRGL